MPHVIEGRFGPWALRVWLQPSLLLAAAWLLVQTWPMWWWTIVR